METVNKQSSSGDVFVSLPKADRGSSARKLYLVLSCLALVYALLAGLRTVVDWDLGWQLATGRWIVQHHHIPAVDVFSYTAQGQPWIYPVGSGLIFYAVYLLGNYTLLSWLGATACVTTTALLLRRGSALTAILAILAVPLIALRTTPRADMFSVVLFAVFLSLLWEQHETGRARLWLLPILMVFWVNLHLGLAAGLALILGYGMTECLEMIWRERRSGAMDRLRRSWPWLIATVPATFVNPWGWRVFFNLFGFMTPIATQSQWIMEWAPAKLSWPIVMAGLSLRTPNSFVLLLIVVALSLPIALWYRQLGAAILLSGAVFLGVRHLRMQVFFSVMVVIIAGSVLTRAIHLWQSRIGDERIRTILAAGATCMLVLLVFVWSSDLVSQRTYLGRTDLSSFGTGLGWWFPERAAAFVEREKIPGEIFNSYDEGGFIAWRLGLHYRNYIDGRAAPFGMEKVQRSIDLMGSLPDSQAWQTEAERYNIQTIIVVLGRYQGVEQFPALREFCASQSWVPVFLDESSAVFLRRTLATESLIQRLHIDCNTVPLPAAVPRDHSAEAFNRWANSAAVLKALGRDAEALSATARALSIYPDSAFVHFTRGDLLAGSGQWRDAEQEFLTAVAIQPNAVSWARLAKIYEQERRLDQAIQAWENVEELDADGYMARLWLGYDDLEAKRPKEALQAFDRALKSVPHNSGIGGEVDSAFYANVAHGRAMAWKDMGDLKRAVRFEEETVQIAPDRSDDWLELATLYERNRQSSDALRARERAAQLMAGSDAVKAQ